MAEEKKTEVPEQKLEEPPVEREESAPVAPQTDDKEEFVHLPAVIASEFGIARSEVRMMLSLGTIEIDGEPWEGNKFDVPAAAVEGKTIKLVSDVRSVQFQYRGPQVDRYTGDRFA